MLYYIVERIDMNYTTPLNSNYYNSASSMLDTTTATAAEIGIWGIIALVLAIVGGILVYFLFVKAKDEPKGNFLKWLKDFLSFKIMWIESILKVIYYIFTIFTILISFALISTSFLAFIAILVGGPILTRLMYEGLMMFIMIWRNTTDIAKNTKK